MRNARGTSDQIWREQWPASSAALRQLAAISSLSSAYRMLGYSKAPAAGRRVPICSRPPSEQDPEVPTLQLMMFKDQQA
jgi:hypothetical protein